MCNKVWSNVGRRPTFVVCKLRFSYSKFAMGDIPISLLFVCLMAFVTVWLSDGFESYYCSPTEQRLVVLWRRFCNIFSMQIFEHTYSEYLTHHFMVLSQSLVPYALKYQNPQKMVLPCVLVEFSFAYGELSSGQNLKIKGLHTLSTLLSNPSFDLACILSILRLRWKSSSDAISQM